MSPLPSKGNIISTFLLKIAVVFVLLSAAGGIIALVAGSSGRFGESEGRIVLTTLAISAAGFVLVPCVVAGGAGRLGSMPVMPALAILATLFGFGLLLVGIWAEPSAESYWQVAGSAVVVGVSLAHVCLLSLAQLAPRHIWLRATAWVLTLVLAAELIGAIWAEDVDDNYWRVVGVSAILALAASLLVPIIQRGSVSEGTPAWSPVAFCPRCAAEVRDVEGAVRCPRCSVRFRVEFLTD